MGEDLKNSVEAADINVQYDTAAKVFLAHKSILSRILVATVDEFKGMEPDEVEGFIEGDVHVGNVPVDPGLTNAENGERIVGLNTVQPEIREGYVTFDVIFYVRMRDGLSQIIINVEAQKDDTPGYDILNRAIFYVSRLISSQKERDFTGSHYNDLKRVYSIWICMNMDECSWDYFHLTDDVIIPGHKWNGRLDLLNIVLLGIPNELPEQGEEYELHRLLSTMFSVELTSNERLNILENEYGIDVKPDFRKELDTMCNL
ncbi:MAG: Rpn family recombination-promoting nuclease/putative transposase, partial [Oscillospiraceae bacterium]|nr:Rpn family recombination-promoting nuclease/putative transposase [Oscillospiraceae bacterium]